ncbi:hypothetical protein TWF594_009550 [Orbilia oligospora]|nr:hypothetical protein TWF706_011686 [Orbilia oligospora]KAF3132421.1 hypothetical protein TWF594_009550 [Orbilia oligospora]
MSISNQALQKAGPTRDRDPGHPVPAAAGGGQVTNHIKAARHSHDTAYGVGTEFTASFYQSLRRRRENVHPRGYIQSQEASRDGKKHLGRGYQRSEEEANLSGDNLLQCIGPYEQDFEQKRLEQSRRF